MQIQPRMAWVRMKLKSSSRYMTPRPSLPTYMSGEPDATATMHGRHGPTKRKAGSGGSHGQGEYNLASWIIRLTIAGDTIILYGAEKYDSDKVKNSSQVQEGGDIRGKRNLRLRSLVLMVADPSTVESDKEGVQLSMKRRRFSHPRMLQRPQQRIQNLWW